MRDRLHSNLIRATAFGTARILERSARTFGWQPASLDPDTLEVAARRTVRLEDFGNPYYREGLGHLVHSLEHEANLHLIGRVYASRLIRNGLVNRLLLQEHRRTRPDVHDAPLRPPIIITGLPRTGSTFLHRMMARLPGFFAPPYWMLVRPLPRRAGEPDATRMSKARREMRWWKVITPSVKAKHKMGVTLPEECMLALALTFQTQLFNSVAPVESYLKWYASSDRGGKYADYRAILMTLQAQRPGETLLLKAPDHLGALDALCAAVPEARIVQLHRDPVAVASSLASLVHTSQFGLTTRREPARLAAYLCDYLEASLRRNLAQRPHLPVPVLDVRFNDLVADPVGTAARILAEFDHPLPPRGRAAMAKYVAKSQAERVPHHYGGIDFGLDDAKTAERFRFYSTQFKTRRDEPVPVNQTLP